MRCLKPEGWCSVRRQWSVGTTAVIVFCNRGAVALETIVTRVKLTSLGLSSVTPTRSTQSMIERVAIVMTFTARNTHTLFFNAEYAHYVRYSVQGFHSLWKIQKLKNQYLESPSTLFDCRTPTRTSARTHEQSVDVATPDQRT